MLTTNNLASQLGEIVIYNKQTGAKMEKNSDAFGKSGIELNYDTTYRFALNKIQGITPSFKVTLDNTVVYDQEADKFIITDTGYYFEATPHELGISASAGPKVYTLMFSVYNEDKTTLIAEKPKPIYVNPTAVGTQQTTGTTCGPADGQSVQGQCLQDCGTKQDISLQILDQTKKCQAGKCCI